MPDARILVVEDEAIEALDIQQRLVGAGYPLPEVAYSGEEGVARAEEMRPDLVLMDIMLGGEIDGVAAAEQILSRLDVPIIFLTAYVDESTFQRAKITEPYGYIVKPFHERALLTAIEMGLYRHRTERELRQRNEQLLQAHQALEEERQRYQELFETAPEGYLVTDLDGSIKAANAAARVLLGLDGDYLAHNLLSRLVPAGDQRVHRSQLEHLRGLDDAGELRDWEMRLRGREGRTFDVMATVRRVQAQEGKAAGLRWSLDDITEGKAAEELILSLSTPILRIRERLLLVPIIGEIDFRRASHMKDTILRAIRLSRARVVVIDLTGVRGMESYAAKALADLVGAARLLGATCIASGLPETACEPLVTSGIGLHNLQMVGDLQEAIERSERLP